jgi:hypothetical protein
MLRDTTVRLLVSWRGRPAGSVIPGLAYGVADVLVNVRRMAEWAPGASGTPLGQQPPPPRPEPAAPPSSAPPAAMAAPHRPRKRYG